MRASAILAGLALTSCSASFAEVRTMPLFGGYSVLEIPRREVPVGARWIEGYGPDGPATPAENVVNETGLTSLTSNRDQQTSVGLRAAPFGSITPSSRDRATFTFGDVTVQRVRDVTRLNLRPGQSFIYEAIKAARVNLQLEQNRRNDVTAGISTLPVDLSGQLGIQNQRTMGVEGRDLFVAYRVMTAAPVRDKRSRGNFRREEDRFVAQAGNDRVVVRSTCECATASAPCPAPGRLEFFDGNETTPLTMNLSREQHQSLVLPSGPPMAVAGGPQFEIIAIELIMEEARPAAEVSARCTGLQPARVIVTRTIVQLRQMEQPTAPGW